MGIAHFAAGANDALQQILQQKFLEQIQRQEQTRQMALDDERRQQQALAQTRWETDRSDRLTRESAAASEKTAAAARENAEVESFIQANPHLAPVVKAIRIGMPVKSTHDLETPDVHGVHEAEEQKRKVEAVAAEAEAREKAQAKYRAPVRIQRTWVTRGGQPAYVPETDIRPGDAPYEKGGKPSDATSSYSSERGTRIQDSVNELVGRVGPWTAGVGSWLSVLPATDAKNFKADLDQLKANIAFSELTEMREASKTGGALGQVSNVELGLLQSALGALDQDQSPANLVKNLKQVAEISARWQKAKAQNGAAPSVHGAAPVQNMNEGASRVDALLKKYGG